MNGASTPMNSTPACSTTGAANVGAGSKGAGGASSKPYAHYRFEPFVDWAELQIT